MICGVLIFTMYQNFVVSCVEVSKENTESLLAVVYVVLLLAVVTITTFGFLSTHSSTQCLMYGSIKEQCKVCHDY